MTKSGEDRSAKYDAKFDAEVVRSRFAATATIAKNAQASLQRAMADKALAVRGILNGYGIYPIMTVLYMSFNNKLYGICRKFSGDVAIQDAWGAICKWYTMGALPSPLQDIWALYSDILGAAPSPVAYSEMP